MDVLRKTWTWGWSHSWKGQRWVEGKLKNIGKRKIGRVLKMARKPTSEEYSKTLIVTGIGIVLIGAIGFAIFLIWEYFPEFVEWAFDL